MGAYVGFSHALGSFKNTFNPEIAPLLYPESASGKARKDGGVLGGYRHIFQNNMTLGVDVSADVYVDNALEAPVAIRFPDGTVQHTDNRVSRQYNLIPSINFGKTFLGRWHVALGLGLGISRFSSRVTVYDDETTILTSKITKASFVPSLRGEYAATQRFSLTGNISYEICKKITKNFDGRAFNPISPDSQLKSSIAPRYVTLKIGAVYRL